MTSITPTCFGTTVSSSGRLRTQSITSLTIASLNPCDRRLPEDGTPVPKHIEALLTVKGAL